MNTTKNRSLRWFLLPAVMLLAGLLVSGALAASRTGIPRETTPPQISSAPVEAVPATSSQFFNPILLEEHFDGPFPPAGWSVVNHGGTCVWSDESGETSPEGNLTAGYGGFADADSDACGISTTMDTSLVSPIFDLSTAISGTALEFASDYRYSAGIQTATVEILNSELVTWTTIWTSANADSNEGVHVDLTPYLGYPDTQLRFRFTATGWGWWWQIDDVGVFLPVPNVEMRNQAPVYREPGLPIPYTVTVQNLDTGIATLTVTNPTPFGASYISGTLSCASNISTCSSTPAYDIANQQIQWIGTLFPEENITLTFLMTPTTSDLCNYLKNWTFLEDPATGLYLQDIATTEIQPIVWEYIDFENAPNATSNGGWSWGTPDANLAPRGPRAAYNGQMLWGTNLSGSYFGGETLTLTLDLRSVPPSPTGVVLFWKQWLDLAPGTTAIMHINQDVYYPYTGEMRNWVGNVLDVTPYVGQTVTVTFELQGNNPVPTYTGWYLDSLGVTDDCPAAFAGWDQIANACPGETIPYPIFVENRTYQTQTVSMTVSGNNWLTTLSNYSVPLSPGEFSMITATVQVPSTAPYGDVDNAYIFALSSPDPYTSAFTLTTRVGDYWDWELPAPIPAMDGAAVSYNGETYYFPGGIIETLKYDPIGHTWIPLAPQPTPAYATNDACFGNDSGGTPVIVLFPDQNAGNNFLHIYHLGSDTWSTASFAGTLLDGMAVAVDAGNNLCYLSGGFDVEMVSTKNLYAFSPAGNTLTPLTPMSQPRAHHASWMTSDGRMCVAGGTDINQDPLDSTQCYQPSTSTWEAENASFGQLPVPLWDMALTQPTPDEVWLMGGSITPFYDAANGAIVDTFYWDSTTMTWTHDADLPMPVYGASADVQQGEIYLIGGATPYGVNNTWPTDSNWRLNICGAQAPTEANLWLEKVADPVVVAINTPFTYTFVAHNDGPSTAHNVLLEDALPAGISVSLPTQVCTQSGGVFTCTLGSIPAGEEQRIDIQAASIFTGTQINYAIVSATEPDPDNSDNIAAAESIFTAQPVQRPLIFDVLPSQGINISPTVITIIGMNFHAGLSVTLDSYPLNHIRRSNQLINALVPAGLPPDTYDISVINPDGQSDTALNAFTVYSDTAPTVYGVFPDSGANDIPHAIIIFGENFVPGTQAMLSGTVPIKLNSGTILTVSLSGNYFINSNFLIAFVPRNVPPATYDLIVFNPDGRYDILSQAYTVLNPSQTDLYGESGDLWSQPQTVRSGQTITVGATVRRQGGVSTTILSADVAFYLGDPTSGTPISLGLSSTGPLPPRGASDASISLDLTGVPPGRYDLFAVIDPANTIPEFDEGNNILSYTLTVLPQSTDTQAPDIIAFRINDGAQTTQNLQVTLGLSATDNIAPAYMFYIEYAYLQSLGTWWPVQMSGWLPYSPIKAAALYATPGVHYVQAWVADAAGNISTPSVSWINLMRPGTAISQYETHPYRLRLHAGDTVRIRLTSGTGDADLYLFGPGDTFIASSENSTPVDEIVFTATQDGVYQIEVEGYAASSTYTLEVLPGSGTRYTPAPAGVQVPKQRGRNRPILSVGEDPSSTHTGLEEVPNTLFILNLPVIMR